MPANLPEPSGVIVVGEVVGERHIAGRQAWMTIIYLDEDGSPYVISYLCRVVAREALAFFGTLQTRLIE